MNAIMSYLKGDPARIRDRRIRELLAEIAQEEEATEAKRLELNRLTAEKNAEKSPNPERR